MEILNNHLYRFRGEVYCQSLHQRFMDGNLAYYYLLRINGIRKPKKLSKPASARKPCTERCKLVDDSFFEFELEESVTIDEYLYGGIDLNAQIKRTLAGMNDNGAATLAAKQLVHLDNNFMNIVFGQLASSRGSSHFYYQQLPLMMQEELDYYLLGMYERKHCIKTASTPNIVAVLLDIIELEFPLFVCDSRHFYYDGCIRCDGWTSNQCAEQVEQFLQSFRCRNFAELLFNLQSYFAGVSVTTTNNGLYNALRIRQFSSLTASYIMLLILARNGIEATVVKFFDDQFAVLCVFNGFKYLSDPCRYIYSRDSRWLFNRSAAVIDQRAIIKVLQEDPDFYPTNGDLQFLLHNLNYLR